jgi:hypothetical protein
LTSAIFGSALAAGGLVSFSSSADVASFDGALNAASIYGGDGADTILFRTILMEGTSLQGGEGADIFVANITVGASGVSFWGGAGGDHFSIDSITGTGGTAYFWNDQAGTDTLVFNSVVSGGAGSGSAAAFFGITLGAAAGLNISFAANQTTNLFNGSTASSAFYIGAGGNQLVSFGFGSTQTTILFAGTGATITLQGGSFETGFGTSIFSNASAATGTGNFGIQTTIPTFS